MKRIIVLFFIILTGLAVFSWSLPDRIKPEEVNDFSNILKKEEKVHIKTAIDELKKYKNVDIYVVIIEKMDEDDYRENATELFKKWKVSSKEKNTGLLIFLALDKEKREGKNELIIEAGNGIKNIINEKRINQIEDQFVIPELIKNNYGEALYKAVISFSEIIKNAPSIDKNGISKNENNFDYTLFFVIVIVIIAFFFLYYQYYLKKSGDKE